MTELTDVTLTEGFSLVLRLMLFGGFGVAMVRLFMVAWRVTAELGSAIAVVGLLFGVGHLMGVLHHIPLPVREAARSAVAYVLQSPVFSG